MGRPNKGNGTTGPKRPGGNNSGGTVGNTDSASKPKNK